LTFRKSGEKLPDFQPHVPDKKISKERKEKEKEPKRKRKERNI
jgi:hypothetical protein